MKDIKDYLHLYLGCDVIAPNPYDDDGKEAKGILTGIHGEYGPEVQFIIDGNAEESPEYPNYENVKLPLRPLSDMTLPEFRELFGESFADSYSKARIKSINSSLWMLYKTIGEIGDFDTVPRLLSKGFDLFGLIEAGLAIDATTLKQTA